MRQYGEYRTRQLVLEKWDEQVKKVKGKSGLIAI